MEKQIAKTEFKTSKGANVVVTAELILQKTYYADGDNVIVDCCEMGLVRANIDGHPQQVGYLEFAKPVNYDGLTIYGTIGKLGLTAENLVKVKSAITELKRHPVWVTKQEKAEKNRQEIQAMETERDAHPGYCQKCGTYCYGDCEAN